MSRPESAYDWGKRHRSCQDALKARKALGPDKTQADWWRVCPRGDWLLWQLDRLPAKQREALRPQVNRVVEVIVTTAIVEHALDCGVVAVEEWAARWLSGEDRSRDTALRAAWAAGATEWAARATAWAAWAARATAWAEWAAARAAEAWATARAADAWAAAWAAERQRQADDIRAEIPEWPGVLAEGEELT